MTSTVATQRTDLVAEYWQAYFEWRSAYGASDVCMGELLAALRVAANAHGIDDIQRTRLNALARMIEADLTDASAKRRTA